MKKVTLNESILKRIVKQVISETYLDTTSSTIESRPFIINSNGTVSIETKTKGKNKKIRFSALGQDINIVKIKPLSNGYMVTSKNGTEKTISKSQARAIINFVDTGRPDEVDSGDWATPNLHMRTV